MDRQLRVVPSPGSEMNFFPNERLMGFIDFTVFVGRGYKRDIENENRMSLPSSRLRVNDQGVVEREFLADGKAEKLLHWRIYHDGKLVESGAAANICRLEMKHGLGNYLILLGVEGPTGFLPVSNYLEFPLFTDGKDRPRIYPLDTNADGTPDFIEDMVKSGNAEITLLKEGQDSDNDGLTDIEEAGSQAISPTNSCEREKLKMMQLWLQWKYDLKDPHRWW